MDARILESSPRYADWVKVFGDNRAPITSPMPHQASLPGIPNALVYWLDLKAITSEQRARLVAHISERFGIPPDEVERDLDRDGVPLMAADVHVSIDLRFIV